MDVKLSLGRLPTDTTVEVEGKLLENVVSVEFVYSVNTSELPMLEPTCTVEVKQLLPDGAKGGVERLRITRFEGGLEDGEVQVTAYRMDGRSEVVW